MAILVAVFSRCVFGGSFHLSIVGLCFRLPWLGLARFLSRSDPQPTYPTPPPTQTQRGETVRFRRFRPEAQALLAELKDKEVRQW